LIIFCLCQLGIPSQENTCVIIQTSHDMMERMSRMLVGEMAGADEEFG
jgi:hypothetical protein